MLTQPKFKDAEVDRVLRSSAALQITDDSTPRGVVPGVVLLLIAVLVIWIRWRLLDVPLDRDEGEYAYMGQLLLSGVPPYREASNMKLPGVYVAYALIEWVFGQSVRGLRLGFLVLDLATMAALFGLARRLFDAKSALWAAAAFAILSQSSNFLSLAGQATHFINAGVVPGFWLLFQAKQSKRLALFFAAGLCFGAAFLMKQQALFLVGAALMWTLFPPHVGRRFKFQSAAIFGVGAALPYGVVCFWLWQSGDFASFWFWTVEYARAYTQLVSLPTAAINFATQLGNFGFDWILIGAGMIGLGVSSWHSKPARELLLWWFVGAFLSAVPGFYFRPHYFIPLLPVICLGVAGGWHHWQLLRRQNPVDRFRSLPIPALIAFLVLMTPILSHSQLWMLQPEHYVRAIYPGNPFVEAEPIARYLSRAAKPGERVAIVGSEPQIYFLARRRAATGFLYAYPLMESQPYALTMQHQMASEIERQDPAWLVFENINWAWGQRPQSHRFIFKWFRRYRQNYHCVALVELRPDENRWQWNPTDVDRPDAQYLSVWRRNVLRAY